MKSINCMNCFIGFMGELTTCFFLGIKARDQGRDHKNFYLMIGHPALMGRSENFFLINIWNYNELDLVSFEKRLRLVMVSILHFIRITNIIMSNKKNHQPAIRLINSINPPPMGRPVLNWKGGLCRSYPLPIMVELLGG